MTIFDLMKKISKRFVIVILICFFNAALFAQKNKPNVILIYTDDIGYGDLSCYGAKAISTPNIDALANSGIKFTNAHSAAATCTPSRYAMMMGEYAFRRKGTSILDGDAPLIIPTNQVNLPQVFKKAGYTTALVGKWHLGLGGIGGPNWNAAIKPGPNEVGFDYAYFFPATADRVPTIFVENHNIVGYEKSDSIKISYKHKIGNEPTGLENPALLKLKALPGQGHTETIVNGIGRIGYMQGGKNARWNDEELAYTFVNKAKTFITQQVKSPFFLYFSVNDIHAPRMPATAFKGTTNLGLRGDMIKQLDWSVGELVNELKRLGIDKNTMIIFTSDNGPALLDGYDDNSDVFAEKAQHQPAGKLRGGKYSIFEAGTRVPMIVNWPKSIKAGVSDELMSQMDFGKSFAYWFKLKVDTTDFKDAENHIQAFLNAKIAGREMLIEQGYTLAIVWNNWKYIEPAKGAAVLMPMNIESGLSTMPQLYDLKNDVGETKNFATAQPELVNKLATQLLKIKNN